MVYSIIYILELVPLESAQKSWPPGTESLKERLEIQGRNHLERRDNHGASQGSEEPET